MYRLCRCFMPSFKIIGLLVLKKNIFQLIAMAAILVKLPWPLIQTSVPLPRTLALIGHAVAEKKFKYYSHIHVQLRFINNIPLLCRKINWPRTLHCMAHCWMVISLAWMKLLQFVYTFMCVKLVVCLYWPWAVRLDRKLFSACTKIPTELMSSFQRSAIGIM